jgi:hypothetical protein
MAREGILVLEHRNMSVRSIFLAILVAPCLLGGCGPEESNRKSIDTGVPSSPHASATQPKAAGIQCAQRQLDSGTATTRTRQ